MSNMSYCRFRNTLSDFEDCADHITDALGKDEHKARHKLVMSAIIMLEEIGISIQEYDGSHNLGMFVDSVLGERIVDNDDDDEEN